MKFLHNLIVSMFLFNPILSIANGYYPSLKELREKKVVMQEWENSCAAASVATVLTYHFNDPVTEKYAAAAMLKLTDPKLVKTQGGFSLADLKIFVEGRGYVGNGYKDLALDDLALIEAPIVPIRQFGYNHYVVIQQVNTQGVLVADPAFGNRFIDAKTFNNQWLQGIAFVITKK